MNKLLRLWLGGLFCAVSFLGWGPLKAQVPVVPSLDELHSPFGAQDYENFESPEKVFYPETWFHYIGGNVSLAGITKDLEAIAAAGFSGIQLFHGQFGGIWPGTDGQITCLSPKWDAAVQHTAKECERLGLRFTMQGCPGWAMAGGPWIRPEQAMRHLVWSRTDVTAKESDAIVLPAAFSKEEDWRDYRDVAVIAFPTPLDDTGNPLRPETVRSNTEHDWAKVLTGEASIQLGAVTKDNPYRIDVTLPQETVVRTVEFPSINGLSHAWCYEPGVNVRVQAVMPDGEEVDILHTDLPQSSWQDDRPITLACRETEPTRNYRITIVNQHDITLGNVFLFSGARKNNWESEAGWTLRSIERGGQSVEQSKEAYVAQSGIVDLSDKMASDGTLDWKVPDGAWTILRIGHVNAGMKNGPAPPEGTGWECDKLSRAGSDTQFDGYIGRLIQNGGALGGGLLNGLLFDSWECKTQTWTPDMEQEFYQRTGYALRKWIPALFGYVVDDPERTARFLIDWRRVVGDLFADNFYGNMAERAKQNGLSISYETAAGDIFPADIMEYYKYADVPMCEFWQPFTEGYVGSLNVKPIKPTASAARLYGKPRVAAEAFTSFNHTWDENFQMLREVANVNCVEGVTHLIFHTYTHNPQVDFLPPGTSFAGAGIGTPFLKGQTWWKYMKEFNTYLARCGYLFERGCPVSDVLWYLGDEIDHKPDQQAPFPDGYKYDYCNPDVLLTRLSVRDGKIVTPEGISYEVLWMPSTYRMLPETLEKIYELLCDGAVVVGEAPKGLATLSGGDAAQRRFDEAVSKIWGEKPASGTRGVGNGKIISGMSIEQVLTRLEIQPDVHASGALWLHRTTGDVDWYYVCAPKGSGFEGVVDFRSTGRVRLWDPVDGSIEDIPCEQRDGRTLVALDLAPSGSCFIVFEKGEKQKKVSQQRTFETVAVLDGEWEFLFPEGWGTPRSVRSELKPWKDLDLSQEGKSFSGTVEYRTSFELPHFKKNRSYQLDLGRVERIAEIWINGKQVETLWTEPYRADVTDYLQKGENTICIKVTNTWFNRLVYDAGQPEEARKTWVLKWPDRSAPLRESGLLGPVVLRQQR